MTKAVLFDFGGTLLSHTSTMDGRHRRAALLAAELGRDDHEAVFEALHLGIESAFERAKALPFYLHLDVAISGFREAVSSLGVTWSEAEGRAMARRTSQMVLEGIEPRPGMRSTLEALRERGLHLGGVSNADDGELEAMVATLGGGGGDLSPRAEQRNGAIVQAARRDLPPGAGAGQLRRGGRGLCGGHVGHGHRGSGGAGDANRPDRGPNCCSRAAGRRRGS